MYNRTFFVTLIVFSLMLLPFFGCTRDDTSDDRDDPVTVPGSIRSPDISFSDMPIFDGERVGVQVMSSHSLSDPLLILVKIRIFYTGPAQEVEEIFHPLLIFEGSDSEILLVQSENDELDRAMKISFEILSSGKRDSFIALMTDEEKKGRKIENRMFSSYRRGDPSSVTWERSR